MPTPTGSRPPLPQLSTSFPGKLWNTPRIGFDQARRRWKQRQVRKAMAAEQRLLDDALLVVGAAVLKLESVPPELEASIEHVRTIQSGTAAAAQAGEQKARDRAGAVRAELHKVEAAAREASTRLDALNQEAASIQESQEVAAAERRLTIADEVQTAQAQLSTARAELTAKKSELAHAEAGARHAQQAAADAKSAERAAIIELGRAAVGQEQVPSLSPQQVAAARASQARLADFTAQLLRYDEDIKALGREVSLFPWAVGAVTVLVTAIAVLASEGRLDRLSVFLCAAAVVLIVPSSRWWHGLFRIAAWWLALFWMGLTVDSPRDIGEPTLPVGRIIALALFATAVGVAYFRLRRRPETRPALAALGLAFVGFLGVSIDLTIFYVDWYGKHGANVASLEAEDDDTGRYWDAYVSQVNKHLRDGNVSEADKVLTRLRRVRPDSDEVRAFNVRLQEARSARWEAEAYERKVKEAQRAAQDQRGAAQVRCGEICLAERDRCWSMYGRNSSSCADIHAAALVCIQQNCR